MREVAITAVYMRRDGVCIMAIATSYRTNIGHVEEGKDIRHL
jgi:hypothetical protein